MKTAILRALPLLPLLTALQPSSAQDPRAADAAIGRADFSDLREKVFAHHIEGVGFVLHGQNTALGQQLLGQVRGVPANSKSLADSVPDPVLKSTKDKGGLDSFVLTLRVQNSLDTDESKAQAATYQWISDAQAGTFWNLDAAAIMDLYFPMGHLGDVFAYDSEKRAAHLRVGYAWERITAGSAVTSVDLREAFIGVGYHSLLKSDRKQQSEFQFGLSYKDNAITNDSQWAVNLNIQPVFRLPGLKFFEKYVIGEHWSLGSAPVPEAEPDRPTLPATTVEDTTPKNSPLEQLKHYAYIKPNFTFKSVFSDFAKSGSINPGSYQVDWGTRLGFGFFHDAFRVSYQFSGVTPLEQIDRSFIFQEARAEYRPTVNSPVVFSARYTKGKRAPSYVNEDRVILAVGIKF